MRKDLISRSSFKEKLKKANNVLLEANRNAIETGDREMARESSSQMAALQTVLKILDAEPAADEVQNEIIIKPGLKITPENIERIMHTPDMSTSIRQRLFENEKKIRQQLFSEYAKEMYPDKPIEELTLKERQIIWMHVEDKRVSDMLAERFQ